LGQFYLNCAGIQFCLTMPDGDFGRLPDWYSDTEPAADSAEDIPRINIEVIVNPGMKNGGGADVVLVPDVKISEGIIKVDHPLYQGFYSIQGEEGRVMVSGYFALGAVLRTILSVIIVDHGGLAVHSSCITRNGKTYLFSGPSGYGKSTIVKLTENPLLYSDEVTLVRKDNSGNFHIFHSPFRSEIYSEPLEPSGEINGIFFIKQDTEVYLEPLSQTQALFKMLPCIFFPVIERNPYEAKIFNLCCDFLRQVRPMDLHFRKDGSFWRCIEEELCNLKE